MLFSVTDAGLRTIGNGGGVGKADGTDILFTASDGTTKLDHELESYSPSTGQTNAWVRIPSLSNLTDTVLYVYYGNAAAADQQNRTAVWDSNYAGVYHLADGEGHTLADSSATARNLTRRSATQPTPSPALIGTGQQLGPANNDYAQAVSQECLQTPASQEIWVQRLESYASKMGKITTSDAGAGNLFFYWWPTGNGIYLNLSGSTTLLQGGTGTGWYHVVVTRNSTAVKAYVNGSLVQTIAVSSTDSFCSKGIGDIYGSASAYANLDEFRWSHTERTAGWVATEYNNQSSPATFSSLAP